MTYKNGVQMIDCSRCKLAVAFGTTMRTLGGEHLCKRCVTDLHSLEMQAADAVEVKAELAALRAVAEAARRVREPMATLIRAIGDQNPFSDSNAALTELENTLKALDRLSLPHDPYSHKTGRMAL